MAKISDRKQVRNMEFFTVELSDGTRIFDCKVANGKTGPFVSGPAKSYTDKDGNTKYINLVSIGKETQAELLAELGITGQPAAPIQEEEIPF